MHLAPILLPAKRATHTASGVLIHLHLAHLTLARILPGLLLLLVTVHTR